MEEAKDIQVQRSEEDIFLRRKDCFFDCLLLNVLLAVIFVIYAFYAVRSGLPKYIWSSVILYIIYLAEVFFSNTFSFLIHAMMPNRAMDRIVNITRNNPIFTWNISCYHYETRIHRVKRTDKNGNAYYTTETKQERVDTYSTSMNAPYKACQDVSTVQDCLEHLPLLEYCRIYINKSYTFSDNDSKVNYEGKKNEFIMHNKRDVHYDFSESFEIPDYVSRICTFGGNDMPLRYNPFLFVFLSLFLLGWIIRIILYLNSFAAEVKVVKKVRF